MNVIKREPAWTSSPDASFADRLFDAFWRNASSFPGPIGAMDVENGTLAPRVDVFEQDTCYLVSVELPGIPKENIDISVADGILVIKAHVESEIKNQKKGQVIHLERYEGRYVRRIDLGSDAASEAIDASLKDGVLNITIPKTKGNISKAVKIQVG